MTIVLLVQRRPVLVAALNATCRILSPFLLNTLAVVEIELAIDDLPRFRIDACCMAFADGVRAVSAVLGRVLFRIGGEQITILRAGEQPGSAHPLPRELKRPLRGRALF